MESKRLMKIKFSSFIKLNILSGIALGFIFGILFFVGSLFGGNVTVNFVFDTFTGIPAGVASIVAVPIFMVLVAAFFSVIAYLPFTLLIRVTKGVTLEGEWK